MHSASIKDVLDRIRHDPSGYADAKDRIDEIGEERKRVNLAMNELEARASMEADPVGKAHMKRKLSKMRELSQLLRKGARQSNTWIENFCRARRQHIREYASAKDNSSGDLLFCIMGVLRYVMGHKGYKALPAADQEVVKAADAWLRRSKYDRGVKIRIKPSDIVPEPSESAEDEDLALAITMLARSPDMCAKDWIMGCGIGCMSGRKRDCRAHWIAAISGVRSGKCSVRRDTTG